MKRMNKLEPIIIKRAEHNISRQLVNPNALRVLYRLRDNGFTACLVGGCVRDLLLGREPKDFDIVTDATPPQIKKIFRNCRLVGRRFRLAHIHFRDEVLEVATFRAGVTDAALDESDANHPEAEAEGGRGGDSAQPLVMKSEDGVLLRDNLFGTPEEDAWRRDFTVNALSYNIADFSIVDYVGGVADLKLGIIRTIGDPWLRFSEDPVRMLRAVRFSAQLGFKIEENCWQAICEDAERIALAAPPRLFDEVLKLLVSREGERCYQLLRQSGLFAALFPFMDEWLSQEENGFPHTELSRALVQIDECCARGEKLAEPLILALFFGGYLEEKGSELKARGVSSRESVDMSVAALAEATAATVFIPHRILLGLREILNLQQRFGKMPGRKPQSVLTRPAFPAALEYLRFRAVREKSLGKTVAWWESYVAGNPVAPGGQLPEVEKTAGDGPRKRRRRRRRSKS